MAKSISDAMTSKPCAIDAEKSVAYAAKMMRDEDVGFAPIVEGDQLIGAVTDRDVAVKIVAEGKDPEVTTVREIASTNRHRAAGAEPGRSAPAHGAPPGAAAAGRGRREQARRSAGAGRRGPGGRSRRHRPRCRADLGVTRVSGWKAGRSGRQGACHPPM